MLGDNYGGVPVKRGCNRHGLMFWHPQQCGRLRGRCRECAREHQQDIRDKRKGEPAFLPAGGTAVTTAAIKKEA
jgi:hypothetical protein